MPPTQTTGPYAAMVDGPDGNVLVTSDQADKGNQWILELASHPRIKLTADSRDVTR